uniref:RNA polymerase beta'' subunit n=1 Tax=Massjukichlorella minus TaxID=2650457 RepID=UPI00241115A9|nr:RNA polymerase beta'' subunit [Massjukichlorella minus]WDY13000.1 RNA polymerase beta'' subunit [Massjukichlorella minus]
MNTSCVYFNQSFDKKRLKALISWILKTFGEKEALRVVEELKRTGFYNATKAGLSIGLNDLITPPQKASLIAKAQVTMNTTHQDFDGARITATERSQRIVDTWHQASETLRKEVVDHFNTYDQLNPVYMMALSGARGNFSQVRQLVGMRGLMADPQGRIISFPIQSNLREGLNLTEYFISCSGARKGVVDTALRTADTGYLTRRLVDVSHHVVVKRVICGTSNGIIVKSLHSNNKVLLPLKDRLVGRVLAQDISFPGPITELETRSNPPKGDTPLLPSPPGPIREWGRGEGVESGTDFTSENPVQTDQYSEEKAKSQNTLSGLNLSEANLKKKNSNLSSDRSKDRELGYAHSKTDYFIAQKDQEISPDLAFRISLIKQQVLIRSPLTCALNHEVCQLCYGWNLAQGSLVTLGEAVGVIAAQSIGEPGTQLTMRTFHTGGVFSGDLLHQIRAPHSGKVFFPKAFQGLLIRTAHGRIAFLTKTPGEIIITAKSETKSTTGPNVPGNTLLSELNLEKIRAKQGTNYQEIPILPLAYNTQTKNLDLQETRLSFQSLTMLFVRQGEEVEKNQLLAELSVFGQEGNQPVKSRQTIFSEFSGRIVEFRGGIIKMQEVDDEDEDEETDVMRFIDPGKSAKLGFFRILSTRIGATLKPKLLPTHFINNEKVASQISQKQPISIDLDDSTLKVPTLPAGLIDSKNLLSQKQSPSAYASNSSNRSTRVDHSSNLLANPSNSSNQNVNPYESPDLPSSKVDLIIIKNRKLSGKQYIEQQQKRREVGIETIEPIKRKMMNFDLLYLKTIAEEGDLVDSNYKCQMYDQKYVKDLNFWMTATMYCCKIKSIKNKMVYTNQHHISNNFSEPQKLLSGEIFKEPLIDVFLTDSEQTAFSLIKCNQSTSVENYSNRSTSFAPQPPDSSSPTPLLGVGELESGGIEAPIFTNTKKSGQSSVNLLSQINNSLKVDAKIGNYVNCGEKIGSKKGNPGVNQDINETQIILPASGKVIKISKTQIGIQKTQPVLFYSEANVHVQKDEWVTRGTPILTLTHETLITGDIVQGIPRIEQLFEARTAPPPGISDGEHLHETLHSQVREIFRKNWVKRPLPTAVRKSLQEIQQILVESIQKVYLSQGVLIADKHIEIVVRQMTCKAQILDSGNTGLLLEEVLSVQQIENANLATPGKKALYAPAVIGLTRSALESDSFISAASFQETTRVLSRDSIIGKSDFLRGLKEKVVIGDLISAGTGLDFYFVYTLLTHKQFKNVLKVPTFNQLDQQKESKFISLIPPSRSIIKKRRFF